MQYYTDKRNALNHGSVTIPGDAASLASVILDLIGSERRHNWGITFTDTPEQYFANDTTGDASQALEFWLNSLGDMVVHRKFKIADWVGNRFYEIKVHYDYRRNFRDYRVSIKPNNKTIVEYHVAMLLRMYDRYSCGRDKIISPIWLRIAHYNLLKYIGNLSYREDFDRHLKALQSNIDKLGNPTGNRKILSYYRNKLYHQKKKDFPNPLTGLIESVRLLYAIDDHDSLTAINNQPGGI